MKHFTYTNFFGEDDLVCIRKSACKWVEPPHTHEFIEFVYIASGKGWHSIKGTRYNVHKGCFLFVNFGQEHEMEATEDTVYYNILFKPEFFINSGSALVSDNAFEIMMISCFEEFRELAGEKSIIQFRGEDILKADMLAETLYREYDSKIPGWETIIKCSAMILLTMALREMTQHFGNKTKSRITSEVLDYIEKHYNEKLSLSELAKKSLYQPSYFSMMFRECYGMTITDYIQKKRIENACRLLRETDLSVDEIGRRIGYNDDVRFYRYFKKLCGSTPNAYRKSQIKK